MVENLQIVPALNLTIFWELLNYLTQSAGNLFSLNFLGILRDYTSGFVFCNLFFTSSAKQPPHILLFLLPLPFHSEKVEGIEKVEGKRGGCFAGGE